MILDEYILDNKLFTREKRFEKILLEDYEQFKSVEVIKGTPAWRKPGIWTKDVKGKKVFDYYDIDPGLLLSKVLDTCFLFNNQQSRKRGKME